MPLLAPLPLCPGVTELEHHTHLPCGIPPAIFAKELTLPFHDAAISPVLRLTNQVVLPWCVLCQPLILRDIAVILELTVPPWGHQQNGTCIA